MDSELQIVARHSETAPVDLAGMFRDLGIEYEEVPITTGESGYIERNGDQYTVVVNYWDSEVRKRFTAAHELAHYLMHRDLMDHGERMNRHTDRLWDGPSVGGNTLFSPHHEVQANGMAAQIIMPADLVRAKFADNADPAWLAKEFRVSKPAMEIRLKTLGLIPR